MLPNKKAKLNLCILLAAIAVGLLCASSAIGATLNVPFDYPTIQSAIDAAENGDTVQVAAGTYVERLDLEFKSIALIGAGAENTIVDESGLKAGYCLGMYQVPDTARVEGFTFTRGSGAKMGFPGFFAGGGVILYESSPTLANNIISGNGNLALPDYGGGLALYYSDATLIGNTITGNVADYGGGVYLYSSSPALENNTITGNSALGGGGVYLWESSPTLTNNIVSGNVAGIDGGGMYIENSCPILMNNTITSNTGGGIYEIFPSGPFECGYPWGSVTNCILWGNTSYDLTVAEEPLHVAYSDIGIQFGSISGADNISADPMFVNPSAGDYHLKADSLCIDAGNPDLKILPLPETDFDGNPRVVDGDGDGEAIVDMGAFEAIVGSTPSGTDIVVEPVDPATGESPVTLTFDNVTEGGVTTVTSTTPSEEQGAPEGFKFGNPPVMYEITTTADYTGSITVCFDYSGTSYGNEANLKLFHREGSSWVDITNPDDPPDNPNPDTINKIICGTVTSLSFFGAFEPELVDPVELLGELAGKVFGMNLPKGIENSLDAKLDAALKVLEDVNENNDFAAINTLEAFINAVEAQSGKKIATEDADALIAAAQEIIAVLSSM